jgi:parallel beta-helix repeat protein
MMNGMMRLAKRQAAGPRLGGSPPVTSGTGYPWVDGDMLYAADLNAAIAGASGTVNVKGAGAVGDGVADDTAAFNAALATIAAQGAGKLYIPSGSYKLTSTMTYNAGRLHIMGDGKSTELNWGSTTADMFHFAGPDTTLSDFKVYTPYQTSTAGALFNFANANNAKLNRLWTDGGYEVVQFLGAPGNLTYRTSITDCNFVNVMGNAVFYDQYCGGVAIIADTEMLGAPSDSGSGIIIFAGDTFTFSNVNIQDFEFGVYVQSMAGGINYVANLFAANVLCDGGGSPPPQLQDGWYFDGSAASTFVSRIHLSGCWAGSMGRDGFRVRNASDVTFANCIAIDNAEHGFMIYAPSSDVTLSACTAVGNSRGASNVNDGIHVVGPVTDFMITGCRCRPNAGFASNTQRYGVFVDASANNRYIISNNDLNGNATAGLSDSGTGATKFVSQNIT